MARPTHVYTIDYVASLIGENLELLQEIARNSYQPSVSVTLIGIPISRRI